jgi:hypothetical protein
MTTQYDEGQWPDLTNFRNACLAERFDEMQRIAALGHSWYENENPQGITMEKLAKVFQAQHYAAENNLQALQKVVESNPWTVNYPWTAQGWLPITQALSTHGDRKIIEILLDAGADPTLMVGSADDRVSVVEMARYGGHPELASWLTEIINDRKGD